MQRKLLIVTQLLEIVFSGFGILLESASESSGTQLAGPGGPLGSVCLKLVDGVKENLMSLTNKQYFLFFTGWTRI